MILDKSNIEWLDSFLKKYKRYPKILHIGNIANNAYLNCKILRFNQIDADLLCYDYFHIMGNPEWEDGLFSASNIDQFNPKFIYKKTNFLRPNWYIQGPLHLSIWYLINKNNKNFVKAFLLKLLINLSHLKLFRKFIRVLFRLFYIFRRVVNFYNINFKKITYAKHPNFMSYELFRDMKELFSQYDLIHAYATDGIYPYFLKKKYVAYEHGTIRTLPFTGTNFANIVKKSYQNANHVFLTNCDNIKSLKKMRIKNYSFIPHPINEKQENDIDKINLYIPNSLKNLKNFDFVIFHPSRQHWIKNNDEMSKGNDLLFYAFKDFVRKYNSKSLLICVKWGEHLTNSKKLIKKLNIENNVVWIDPQPHLIMSHIIRLSDVIVDQFVIGSFGSIMPKALFYEKPVIINLNKNVHKRFFKVLPPVTDAKEINDILLALINLYNQKSKSKSNLKKWYMKYHSNSVIANKLLKVYKNII